MKWSDLPYITDSQVHEVQALLPTVMFIDFISKCGTTGTITVYADVKHVTITKRGKVSITVSAKSIQYYLAQLHKAQLLYNVDDDIEDIVWLTANPTKQDSQKLSLAQLLITRWREANPEQDVFSLYPKEVWD